MNDDKNKPLNDQKQSSESESTKVSSVNGKRRIKNSYLRKPVQHYNWNQPIWHIESYTLTVIQHKKRFKVNTISTMILFLPLPFTHKSITLDDKYNHVLRPRSSNFAKSDSMVSNSLKKPKLNETLLREQIMNLKDKTDLANKI